jgi:hypothetical protein
MDGWLRLWWRWRRSAADSIRWALTWVLPAFVLRTLPRMVRVRCADAYAGEGYQVVEAAGILEISEYDLLGLAYRETFRREAARALLDRAFTQYMLAGNAPTWAIAFAAEVIDLFESGRLAERDFALHTHPPPTARDILMGLAQCLLLLFLLGIIFVAFSTYTPP